VHTVLLALLGGVVLPPLDAWRGVGTCDRETNGWLCVTGTGNDSSYWRTPPLALATNALYRVCFEAKADRVTSGCIIAGPDFCNRDFPIAADWQEHGFVFVTPGELHHAFLRFGQWEVATTIRFRNFQFRPTQAVHDRFGAGESVSGRHYRFRAPLDSESANYSRPLASFRCGFNSNRWVFQEGAEVVYDHAIHGCRQTAAAVEIGCCYHAGGTGVIEASPDGANWKALARIKKTGTTCVSLPDGTRFVRIRAITRPAYFQVNEYQYHSTLDNDLGLIQGTTVFPDIEVASDRFPVMIRSWTDEAIQLETGAPMDLTVSVNGRPGQRVAVRKAGWVMVPCSLQRSGGNVVTLSGRVGREEVYRATVRRQVPVLHDASYGYALPTPGLWWCEGTYKVSQNRPMPTAQRRRIEVAAARHEYEPVQLVLRPQKDLKNLRIRVTGLNGLRVRTDWVEYVEVTRPTDAAGTPGRWPDPLPPFEQGTTLEAGRNHPIWFTVYVPPEQKPGDYDGHIELTADGWRTTVPVRVHVWNFTLPKEAHLQTAFGLDVEMIRRYHNLTTTEELRQVLDLYLANFATHRVAPYDPSPLDPYRVSFTETNAVMDFTAFDRVCEKWLDEQGFNAIRIHLHGLGGGTFYERAPGRIGRYEQGSPEYERLLASHGRQLVEHLRAKGWLPKAYVYWFDEPDKKDYEFVANTMKRIGRVAPGLTRMLTEQPEPELYGFVDLWCPVVSAVDAKTIAARRKEGERFWWYLCCGPHAPYIGLFIDHPAVDLRVWAWLSRKWGVTGLLVWQVNYWNSATAFLPPDIQNPWQDPMSYQSGYGKKPGEIGYWGNGDGRFLYPPNRDVKTDKRKHISGPISSLRWEMLREGIEDYEYFILLDEAIAAAKQRGVATNLIRQAEQLAIVPDAVIADAKTYSHDPQPLHQHRRQIAEMIERLAFSGR